MNLQFGSQKNMNISYFVQTATIKGIQATYNNEVWGINWDVDLSILLDVTKKNGEVYHYSMDIRGTFSKDSEGNIIGWGSAFKVARLFEKLGITGKLTEDGKIPEVCLQSVIEKEITVLFYRIGIREDGNVKFQCWDVVDSDKQSLLAEFESAQLKGYPRNYVPSPATEENADVQSVGSVASSNNDDLIDDFVF